MALGGCPIQSSFSAVFNDLDGQCSQVMKLCPPPPKCLLSRGLAIYRNRCPWTTPLRHRCRSGCGGLLESVDRDSGGPGGGQKSHGETDWCPTRQVEEGFCLSENRAEPAYIGGGAYFSL